MQVTVESAAPQAALSLEDLAAMRFGQLESVYRGGSTPKTLQALDGALLGRMLAVRRLDFRPLADAIQRFAGSERFVWAGKTFESQGPVAGHGINRIHLPGLIGRQTLFPFHTRFDHSAIDGKRAIVLDYDLPENPLYIRKIHDEVREVSPGVFLGPAMWKARRGPVTLLWFALDTGRR